MTNAVAPTRNRTARSRRDDVVEAAYTRFTQYGYGPTSLRDIASEAGMSHAGLLRHFSNKEHLLECTLQRNQPEAPTTHLGAPELRDYLLDMNGLHNREALLRASLAGEATDDDHPAHAFITASMSGVWAVAEASLQGLGLAPEGAHDAALRLCASASGLVLQDLYDSGLRPPAQLLDRQIAVELGHDVVDVGERSEPAGTVTATPPTFNHRRQNPAADHRRAAITTAALQEFAANGYRGTTLRAIADAAGMAHSSVLRHFPKKEMLVMEVVRLRDSRDIDTVNEMFNSPEPLLPMRELIRTARANEQLGNVIALYTKLSCESVFDSHPCHEYFTSRLEDFRLAATYMFIRADRAEALAPGRDPSREAQSLLALWDGLQRYQAYFPSVNIANHLLAHLTSVLTVPLEG